MDHGQFWQLITSSVPLQNVFLPIYLSVGVKVLNHFQQRLSNEETKEITSAIINTV